MDEPQRLQQEDSPAENSPSDSHEGYWDTMEEKIVDTFDIAANLKFLVQEASNIDFPLRNVRNGYRIPHLQSIEHNCGIPFSLIEKETDIPCEEAYERLARPLIMNGYGYRQEEEEYEVPYEEEKFSEESKTNETRTTEKVGQDMMPQITKLSWIGRNTNYETRTTEKVGQNVLPQKTKSSWIGRNTNETRKTEKVGQDVLPQKTKSSWIGRNKSTKNNTLSTQRRFSFFRRRSLASF